MSQAPNTMNINSFFLIMLILICTPVKAGWLDELHRGNEGSWTEEIGDSALGFLYPSKHASYFATSVDFTNHEYSAIKISGQIPYARFFNFQVAFNKERNLASLHDYQVELDDNHDINEDSRNYTIYVTYEDVMLHESINENNVIRIPRTITEENIAVERVSILHRIYLTDVENDETGSVALPKIQAFDITNAREYDNVVQPYGLHAFIKNNAYASTTFSDQLAFRRLFNDEFYLDNIQGIGNEWRELRTVNYRPEGYAPSSVNFYFAAPLGNDILENSVIEMKFRMPNYAKDQYKDAQVRFVTVEVGNSLTTYATSGIPDKGIKVDEQGFAKIIIGPRSALLKEKAIKRGYTYIAVPRTTYKPVVFVRNCLPPEDGDFISIQDVPQFKGFDAQFTRDDYWADLYIGDWAPVGRKIRAREWLNDQLWSKYHRE